jgi:hypothetical protein
VQAELDRNAEELAAALAQQSERTRSEAYEVGRRLVVDLVTKAADRARNRLVSGHEEIGPDVAAQAASRLGSIDEMLGALS